MQILLNEGTEGEKTKGLGFFDGTVIELDRKKCKYQTRMEKNYRGG